MNTRAPSKGQSAPTIPNAHAAPITAEGHGVDSHSPSSYNSVGGAQSRRLAPSDVMMLQRAIGNRSVQRLLYPQKSSPPASPAPSISRAPAHLIQTKVDINQVEHKEEGDPATKWGFSPDEVSLYKELITSKETTHFRDEAGLVSYVKHYAGWFSKHPNDYRDQAKGPNVEPITSTKALPPKRVGGEIRSEIEVVFQSGAKEIVNVFSSEKRHLLDTFTQNKGKPPDSKTTNTIVTDVKDFVQGFETYAQAQAISLQQNVMMQGFRPKLVSFGTPEVDFSSDQNELPNESYDRHNAIHSFPSSGSKVFAPSQETYAKIVTLASYLYNTDDYARSRKLDHVRKRKQRAEHIAGWKRNKDLEVEIKHQTTGVVLKKIKPNQELLSAAERERDLLATKLPEFAKLGLNLKDSPAVIAGIFDKLTGKDKGMIMGNIKNVIDGLVTLASIYGAVPEVDPGADLSVPLGEAAALYQDLMSDPVAKPVIAALVHQFPPKNDLHTVTSTAPDTSVTRSMKYKNAKDDNLKVFKVEKATTMEAKVKMLQTLLAALQTSGVDFAVDM
jgi:hypothetical protein